MDWSKKKHMKKIIVQLVNDSIIEQRTPNKNDYWFNYTPSKEEMARTLKPYDVIVLNGKEFRANALKNSVLIGTFKEVLEDVYAIPNKAILHQMWNDYRLVMLYLNPQRMKRRDRRKKKNQMKLMYNFYMG